jgi:hypothetical protein
VAAGGCRSALTYGARSAKSENRPIRSFLERTDSAPCVAQHVLISVYIVAFYSLTSESTYNVLPRALLVFAASDASARQNEIYHSESKN